ncbi:SRPBCC family protein [Fulvivirga sp. 29W222]|uniref:SRPBCC family protein n=1 Tax=Fulvivirga marina TaxID=2494733 RepID=A0A937FYD0_9BACT|nr:SRPBCC family protein [Fulvivirga marina]MBL6446640.1 SRPBCC family protein [Fulvivirga marina]
MSITEKSNITVEAMVNAPVEKVWKLWTSPDDITKWNSASDDWHTPSATNDLRVGGRFTSRMEAKDGSMGFDFGGVYSEVKSYEVIKYTMDDERKVSVLFSEEDAKTKVTETFEAEDTNSVEMQRNGWQAILDNFKKYAEAKKGQ